MPKDVDQNAWRGFEALEHLSKQSSSMPALAEAAKELHSDLGRTARGGPIIAFIARDGEQAVDDIVLKNMDHFLGEVERMPPKYQQPAFQCLDDFKKAQADGMSRVLAGLSLAVCLAERLLSIRIER